MNIGHYGVSLALKKADKNINLGLLFFGVQFVDILWAVLVLLGIERAVIAPGITAANPITTAIRVMLRTMVTLNFPLGFAFQGARPRQFVFSAFKHTSKCKTHL